MSLMEINADENRLKESDQGYRSLVQVKGDQWRTMELKGDLWRLM